MLKKLLLLTVAFAGFNCANIGAMNDKALMEEQPNIVLNQTLQTYNDQQKTILGTLKDESKYAGVAMVCHGATLLGGMALYKYAINPLKFFPQRNTPHWAAPLAIAQGLIINGLCVAGTVATSAYVGKKITNMCHEYMDTEKHKIAHLVGFGGAVGGLLALNALRK